MKASNDAAHSDFPLSISTVESLTFHIHLRGWKESTSFYVAGNYESQQRRGLQRLSTLTFHSGKPHFPHSLLRVESERLFRRVWKLLKPATAGPPATFHSQFPQWKASLSTFIAEGGKRAPFSTWLETMKASNDAAYSDFPPSWNVVFSLSTYDENQGLMPYKSITR